MSRYLASFYHLLMSLVVLVGMAYLVVFVWYPDFFYSIEGGWEGMRLIIGIDLVLGPLLTLVIFKSGKPGLKFDLTCIGTVQALCLTAGLYVVYSERPTFFIFYEGHFYSASTGSYADYGLTAPNPNDFSDVTPAMVVAGIPEDPIEEADYRAMLFSKRTPLWTYAEGYEPLAEHIDKILTNGIAYDEIKSRDEHGALTLWLQKYGGSFEDYAFLPVHSRYGRPFIGIRKSDRSFVDVVRVSEPAVGD